MFHQFLLFKDSFKRLADSTVYTQRHAGCKLSTYGVPLVTDDVRMTLEKNL
jgi:hypothetical protein